MSDSKAVYNNKPTDTLPKRRGRPKTQSVASPNGLESRSLNQTVLTPNNVVDRPRRHPIATSPRDKTVNSKRQRVGNTSNITAEKSLLEGCASMKSECPPKRSRGRPRKILANAANDNIEVSKAKKRHVSDTALLNNSSTKAKTTIDFKNTKHPTTSAVNQLPFCSKRPRKQLVLPTLSPSSRSISSPARSSPVGPKIMTQPKADTLATLSSPNSKKKSLKTGGGTTSTTEGTITTGASTASTNGLCTASTASANTASTTGASTASTTVVNTSLAGMCIRSPVLQDNTVDEPSNPTAQV